LSVKPRQYLFKKIVQQVLQTMLDDNILLFIYCLI